MMFGGAKGDRTPDLIAASDRDGLGYSKINYENSLLYIGFI